MDHKGQRYVLSVGIWFQVASNLLEIIQQRIDSIPDITDSINLDSWPERENEDKYNTRVANSRGWALLDRRNFPLPLPSQKVEICDLLTPEKQLICVKRMDQSSTLSHLFAQGTVSAELIAGDVQGYRARILDALAQVTTLTDFGTREDWTIVYAIATNRPEPLSQALYFFSKVMLDRAARRLKSLGFSVAVAKIEAPGGKPPRRRRAGTSGRR